MAGDRAVDTISLTDGEGRLLVRVLGRHMPGVLPWHAVLDAEITVTSGFAQGRLGCLDPDDLDRWSYVLTAGRRLVR